MFIAESHALAFLFYCFVQGITPGPANTVSFAAGMAYGIRRALKQWVGLVVGFLAVSVLSFVLLWSVGQTAKTLIPVISWAGAAYILYLAVHIVLPAKNNDAMAVKEPTFKTGFVVQMTNAKIAIACVAAFSSYVIPYTQEAGVMTIAVLAMPLVGTLCNLTWLVGGSLLTSFYKKHEVVVNILMATALVLCALSMVCL